MLRPAHILGIFLGLAFSALLLSSIGGHRTQLRASGAMMSECDGALREIVIQYVHGANDASSVYQQFLPMLASDVTVDVVCADRESFEELRGDLHATACTIRPIITSHDMTAWSRDRWVALLPCSSDQPTTLLAPLRENATDAWPARAGDERVAFDIASALSPRVVARRSDVEFDGGDLLCDGENVFVTGAVLRRNLNQTVASRDELLRQLENNLHRHVVFLNDCPDHHAGMFMMAAADHTMLVADPKLAKDLVRDRSEILHTLPGGADFGAETQRKLDAIASQCTSMGYHVVRIPSIPGMDGKTYLTYVNVITEIRAGRRIVYMPVFRGAEQLNDAAERVWRQMGYDVKRVDCTSTYRSFGNLHCLVNVLARVSQ